ncbi:MAG: DUF1707 domain-containing protein [Gaiellaceae bacterium]
MNSETPAVRASDAEREQAVGLLRQHVASGRLTLEEFSERIDAAYDARTVDELTALSADLPVVDTGRRPRRLTAVAFGNVEVTGRWRMPKWKLVLVLFGDVDIDLRGAELPGEKASLRAVVLFGNVDVYVPEAVEVDLGGLTVMGHRRDWGAERPVQAGSPLVRVRVFGLFATADVWRVPAELASRSFREVVRTLRRRRRGELEA